MKKTKRNYNETKILVSGTCYKGGKVLFITADYARKVPGQRSIGRKCH